MKALSRVRIGVVLLTFFLMTIACVKKTLSIIPMVRKDNMKKVQRLLKKEANVHERDARGFTALMVAAEKGYTATGESLLKHGADIQAKDPEQSRTALYLASVNGHTTTVKALLDHGADVNTTDAKARTIDVQIGSKDGALPHCCDTSPSGDLRTGQATPRCIRLASERLSQLSGRWP